MADIEFYFRPEHPVVYDSSRISMLRTDFHSLIQDEDKRKISKLWEERKRDNRVFSKPRNLGCLYDTSNNVFTFITTDFMTYLATTLTYRERTLSEVAYDKMRVAAIGVALRLRDGSIFIHRRSGIVTHQKNVIDSSVGGLAHVENGTIDFQRDLLEKLRRELKISEEEINRILFTGVHSSCQYDLSGMFDFLVETDVDPKTIKRRIDRNYFGDYYIVQQNTLPQFIILHYSSGDMSGDGCATLLSSLNNEKFEETVGHLRMLGKNIKSCQLNTGRAIG